MKTNTSQSPAEFILMEISGGILIKDACKQACGLATQKEKPVRFEWSSGAKTLTLEINPDTKVKDAIAMWRQQMNTPHTLGVCPRNIWIENRRQAIEAAMARFKKAGVNNAELQKELQWLEKIS